VQQPNAETNLAEASLHHPPTEAEEERQQPRKKDQFTIGALGAGSDYVAFLDYLGVASMNEGFSGQTKSGIYHSIYDSTYWYEHFSDGDFVDGKALSQYTATALLRLGDSSILPFEFGHFADTVSGYLDEIQKEAQKSGKKLDFEAVRAQVQTLRDSGKKYDTLLATATQKSNLDGTRVASLNAALMRTERALTRPEGLPNREWYKHQIYAPGFYTGYGVKTLPGIREAVDSKNWSLADKETQVVADCLQQMNQAVNDAVNQLSGM
jgi:N-acetylated-alpha-linked acidic dipeptidase